MSAADVAWARSIIEDPQFKVEDGFVIRRWKIVPDQDGIGVRSFDDILVEGAIIPSGSIGVTREAEGERQGSEITIFTVTPILTGDSSTYGVADHVIYEDAVWKVTGQDDFLRWGFNVATASLVVQGEEIP